MKKSYKNIEFAEGLNIPFADFKERFRLVKLFRDMQPKTRETELLKAHKIACSLQYIEVKEAKEITKDGDIITATRKSRKTKSRKD